MAPSPQTRRPKSLPSSSPPLLPQGDQQAPPLPLTSYPPPNQDYPPPDSHHQQQQQQIPPPVNLSSQKSDKADGGVVGAQTNGNRPRTQSQRSSKSMKKPLLRSLLHRFSTVGKGTTTGHRASLSTFGTGSHDKDKGKENDLEVSSSSNDVSSGGGGGGRKNGSFRARGHSASGTIGSGPTTSTTTTNGKMSPEQDGTITKKPTRKRGSIIGSGKFHPPGSRSSAAGSGSPPPLPLNANANVNAAAAPGEQPVLPIPSPSTARSVGGATPLAATSTGPTNSTHPNPIPQPHVSSSGNEMEMTALNSYNSPTDLSLGATDSLLTEDLPPLPPPVVDPGTPSVGIGGGASLPVEDDINGGLSPRTPDKSLLSAASINSRGRAVDGGGLGLLPRLSTDTTMTTDSSSIGGDSRSTSPSRRAIASPKPGGRHLRRSISDPSGSFATTERDDDDDDDDGDDTDDPRIEGGSMAVLVDREEKASSRARERQGGTTMNGDAGLLMGIDGVMADEEDVDDDGEDDGQTADDDASMRPITPSSIGVNSTGTRGTASVGIWSRNGLGNGDGTSRGNSREVSRDRNSFGAPGGSGPERRPRMIARENTFGSTLTTSSNSSNNSNNNSPCVSVSDVSLANRSVSGSVSTKPTTLWSIESSGANRIAQAPAVAPTTSTTTTHHQPQAGPSNAVAGPSNGHPLPPPTYAGSSPVSVPNGIGGGPAPSFAPSSSMYRPAPGGGTSAPGMWRQDSRGSSVYPYASPGGASSGNLNLSAGNPGQSVTFAPSGGGGSGAASPNGTTNGFTHQAYPSASPSSSSFPISANNSMPPQQSNGNNSAGGSYPVHYPTNTNPDIRHNPHPAYPPGDNASLITLASSSHPNQTVSERIASAAGVGAGGSAPNLHQYPASAYTGRSSFRTQATRRMFGGGASADEDASVRALPPSRRDSEESLASKWSVGTGVINTINSGGTGGGPGTPGRITTRPPSLKTTGTGGPGSIGWGGSSRPDDSPTMARSFITADFMDDYGGGGVNGSVNETTDENQSADAESTADWTHRPSSDRSAPSPSAVSQLDDVSLHENAPPTADTSSAATPSSEPTSTSNPGSGALSITSMDDAKSEVTSTTTTAPAGSFSRHRESSTTPQAERPNVLEQIQIPPQPTSAANTAIPSTATTMTSTHVEQIETLRDSEEHTRSSSTMDGYADSVIMGSEDGEVYMTPMEESSGLAWH